MLFPNPQPSQSVQPDFASRSTTHPARTIHRLSTLALRGLPPRALVADHVLDCDKGPLGSFANPTDLANGFVSRNTGLRSSEWVPFVIAHIEKRRMGSFGKSADDASKWVRLANHAFAEGGGKAVRSPNHADLPNWVRFAKHGAAKLLNGFPFVIAHIAKGERRMGLFGKSADDNVNWVRFAKAPSSTRARTSQPITYPGLPTRLTPKLYIL